MRRFLRYLVSAKNLIGCLLAVVGLALHLVLGGLFGPFWPLVVATRRGNQGSPTDPLPPRNGGAATESTHTARGTRAYAPRPGPFHLPASRAVR